MKLRLALPLALLVAAVSSATAAAAGGEARITEARSPFPEEELQQRRRQRTGRSLAEVLERLGQS